eukprot:3463629-Pyramimonas_sp.AAC.1
MVMLCVISFGFSLALPSSHYLALYVSTYLRISRFLKRPNFALRPDLSQSPPYLVSSGAVTLRRQFWTRRPAGRATTIYPNATLPSKGAPRKAALVAA